MGAAVEVLPVSGVAEAEVGAAVHDQRVVTEPGREGTGLAVRQREEDHVVAGEGLDRGLGQHPVGQRREVRLERAECLAGVRAGGQGADLHLGMPQQQTQQLTAGVPAGSGNSDLDRAHMHDHT